MQRRRPERTGKVEGWLEDVGPRLGNPKAVGFAV